MKKSIHIYRTLAIAILPDYFTYPQEKHRRKKLIPESWIAGLTSLFRNITSLMPTLRLSEMIR